MADSYEKTEVTGLGGRIGNSIKGLLFGVVLFLASFVVLYWNEGRAVTTAKTLTEGAAITIDAPADKILPDNAQKLIHVAGQVETTQTLADMPFGVSAQAIKLRRKVEVYQWTEAKDTRTEKQLGGSEKKVTKYTYKKEWKEGLNDSSKFDTPGEHANPAQVAYASKTEEAQNVMLGALALPSSLISQIDNFKPLAMAETNLAKFAPELRGKSYVQDGAVYVPASGAVTPKPSGDPQVGDLRVAFSVVEPGPVSVIGQQVGNSLAPYVAATGETILMLKVGTQSAQQMVQGAQQANTTLTWILRGVGFLMMFFGIMLVFAPLAVVADVIPFVGTLVRMGTGIAALVPALVLSLATIAVSWVRFRPVLGLSLLIVAGLVLVAGIAMRRKKRVQKV